MKQRYEGQGLERFWYAVLTLAILGGLVVLGWSLYVLWRALT
jgi:hypothetical protein